MKMITQLIVAALIAMFSLTAIVACSESSTHESGGQYMDSTMVTTKVKTALLNTPGLNSAQVSVKTYKGTVQLSGFVDSTAQAQLAGQTASQVSGVNKVENDLKVRADIGNQ